MHHAESAPKRLPRLPRWLLLGVLFLSLAYLIGAGVIASWSPALNGWDLSVCYVAGTTAGIYYTFTLPFSADIPKGTWMTNLGIICAGTLVCAAIIYVLGRRSATKLSDDDRLVHLATLEPMKES